MGKLRRERQKFHLTSPGGNNKNKSNNKNDLKISLQNEQNEYSVDSLSTTTTLPLNSSSLVSGNIFANLNINLGSLNRLNDDARSVRSFKSVKSQFGGEKVLSKKEKLELKKELLMKKIDTVQQMKKEALMRKKRKNNSIIGDTNPLRDALPSLESLLKTRNSFSTKNQTVAKKKGVEKAKKRKKEVVEGVKTFKKLMQNEKIKKNPLEAMKEHVNAILTGNKRL